MAEDKGQNPQCKNNKTNSHFTTGSKNRERDVANSNMAATAGSKRKDWPVIPSLFARQQGLLSPGYFTKRASGSTGLVQRLKLHSNLKYHDGCVNTLHYSPTGELLASGSDDLDIVIWDWAKKKKVLHYESGHASNVFQAKFMPFSSESTLVSCARDGQVRVGFLSSTGTSKGTKKLSQHRGAAHKLSIEPGSPWTFFTCGEDGVVFQVDLREDKAHKLFCCRASEHKKVPLYTIYVNPSNINEFAVGGRDQFARIYDRRKLPEDSKVNAEPVKQYCPHHLDGNDFFANITCLVYSHDGSELLVSYNDEDIYLFDSYSSSGAEFVKQYKGHRNNATVKGVNFYGPESEFVVSGSDCGHVFLWDKQTEEIVNFLDADATGVVNCLEPHPSAPVLATSGLDHDVKIWVPLEPSPTVLDGLDKLMEKNTSDRDDDRSRPHDPISEHLLYLMMHHMQRRRRSRAADNDSDNDEDSSEEEEDDDDDEDDDGQFSGRVQCSPS
ncbi:DDB1- and CUL4-associated factor 8 isoform X2 [Nematostella vectensis]|uniref:DDB1- and CUL4-associated factor 8 isoform X2 n=1 Tax=Nematostella vectensis TaxID=45351 RepID=UPI00207720F5|nr:DDB1- and CUL4-associated factor 8 isoform X2 [Nematostella vectensis]